MLKCTILTLTLDKETIWFSTKTYSLQHRTAKQGKYQWRTNWRFQVFVVQLSRVMIGKEDTDLCSQLSSLIGFRKNEIIFFHSLSLPQFIYSEKSVQIFRLQNFFSVQSFLWELCLQLSSLIGFRKKELIVFNSKKIPPLIYLETSVKIFRMLNLTCYFLKKTLVLMIYSLFLKLGVLK